MEYGNGSTRRVIGWPEIVRMPRHFARMVRESPVGRDDQHFANEEPTSG